MTILRMIKTNKIFMTVLISFLLLVVSMIIESHVDTGEVCAASGSQMSGGYSRTIPDGDYVIASAEDPLFYLDIEGFDIPGKNGTNVLLCGKSSSIGEVDVYDVWTVKYSEGFYQITQKDTNMALTVKDASTAEGANVQINQKSDSLEQKWAIVENGRNGYRLKAKCSGNSLDIANGDIASGNNIWQYTDNDSKAQSWLFIPYRPTQSLPDGDCVILSAANPLLFMDIVGTSRPAEKGANVQIWESTSLAFISVADSWTIKSESDGYYSIVQRGTDIYLDINDSKTAVNENVKVWENNGSPAQKFAITGLGDNKYLIRAKCSGHALDINNGNLTGGENVKQWTCNGSNAQAWRIIPVDKTISELSIAKSQYIYEGKSISPETTVKDKMKNTLKKDTDYTVSYQNNTNAGTAKAIVIGKGIYTGNITKEFVINKKTITSSMASSVSQQNYTGQSITPVITIKDGTTELDEDTDYTVSYQNNTNAGTAKIIVTGKGNYTGSVTNEFVINKKNITSSMVSTVSNQVYTGKSINPSVKVADGANNIIKDTDYVVSYNNNKEIGKAKAIITGIGNYTGKVTKNFTIGLAKTKLTGKVSKTKQKNKLKKVKCAWKKIAGAQKYRVIANGKTCWAKSNKISLTFKKPASSLKLDIRAYRKVNKYSTYGPKYALTIK